MEKIIKDFKNLSTFFFALAAFQVVNAITSIKALEKLDINSLTNMDYASMGISANTALSIVKVTAIIPMVLGVLILLYLAIKGRREAADPSPAKLHIILAAICAVCYVLSFVEGAAGLFDNTGDLLSEILNVILSACSATLMGFYFYWGRKIRTKE